MIYIFSRFMINSSDFFGSILMRRWRSIWWWTITSHVSGWIHYVSTEAVKSSPFFQVFPSFSSVSQFFQVFPSFSMFFPSFSKFFCCLRLVFSNFSCFTAWICRIPPRIPPGHGCFDAGRVPATGDLATQLEVFFSMFFPCSKDMGYDGGYRIGISIYCVYI